MSVRKHSEGVDTLVTALLVQEAVALLDKRLPIPAYDHILKLSHTFNVLDARGAVGLSERQANFGRMRALSRRVAELFTARRVELGLPLGEVPAPAGKTPVGLVAAFKRAAP